MGIRSAGVLGSQAFQGRRDRNMTPLTELLKQTQGKVITNEDGFDTPFELLPPMTSLELSTLAATLPCRIPEEVRELLTFAKGFTGGNLEEITFSGLAGGFGMEAIFPHALPLAADGFGNYWIVDLTSQSKSWGPIFYACHDAPVIVYQAADLLRFVQEVIRFGNKPWQSEVDDVHETLADRIWRENPGVLTQQECLSSSDSEIRSFAQSLDNTWQFVDLRSPALGDGFSWGRYGARTCVQRHGEDRIFAYQKKSRWARFLDALH